MLKFDLQTFAEGGPEGNEPTGNQEPIGGNEPTGGNDPAGGADPTGGNPPKGNTEPDGNTEPVEVNFESIKVPDGWEMDDSFKAAVKDLGLNQEGAQKLVGYIKTDVVDSLVEEQSKAKEELMNKWVTSSHTEFSNEEIESAKLAYKNLADDELKELMDNTGLGNNPAVIRMFAKLGKMTGEGHLIFGGAHDKMSPAERMFRKSMESK